MNKSEARKTFVAFVLLSFVFLALEFLLFYSKWFRSGALHGIFVVLFCLVVGGVSQTLHRATDYTLPVTLLFSGACALTGWVLLGMFW